MKRRFFELAPPIKKVPAQTESSFDKMLMDAISKKVRINTLEGEWKNFVATLRFSGRKICNGVGISNFNLVVEVVEPEKE